MPWARAGASCAPCARLLRVCTVICNPSCVTLNLDTTELLFRDLLGGVQPTVSELEIVMHKFADEDQYLEYKDSSIVDGSAGASAVRAVLASFANTDGGVLIIGVTEPVKDKDGAVLGPRMFSKKSKRKTSLHDWASRLLLDDLLTLDPPVRLARVDTADVEAVVISIARSERYLRADKRIWVRIGDSSLPIGHSLEADLLLGRRRHPHFSIPHSRAVLSGARSKSLGPHDAYEAHLEIVVTVENCSIQWADHVHVGLVLPSLREGRRSIPDDLVGFFDSPQEGHQLWPSWHLAFAWADKDMNRREFSLGPYALSSEVELGSQFYMPILTGYPQRLRGALYVVGRGSVPRWLQMNLNIPRDTVLSGHSKFILGDLTATPVGIGRRPVVDWSIIGDGPPGLDGSDAT